MPIYEYRCKKCGKIFEHLARSISESAPKCPKCGASQPEKQLSSFVAGVGGGGKGLSSCATGTCPTGTCPLG
ncbi:MAG: zinc ribbon domain-containing protein [Verrucomicrobiota bacterium]